MDDQNDTTARIRELNDAFRQDPYASTVPGKSYMTRGIADLPPADQLAIFKRVCTFDDFTEDNDPHGEHDFGAFDYHGQKIFWKIDYYAPDMEHSSENPADPKQTIRVLTTLLAKEY